MAMPLSPTGLDANHGRELALNVPLQLLLLCTTAGAQLRSSTKAQARRRGAHARRLVPKGTEVGRRRAAHQGKALVRGSAAAAAATGEAAVGTLERLEPLVGVRLPWLLLDVLLEVLLVLQQVLALWRWHSLRSLLLLLLLLTTLARQVLLLLRWLLVLVLVLALLLQLVQLGLLLLLRPRRLLLGLALLLLTHGLQLPVLLLAVLVGLALHVRKVGHLIGGRERR